MADKKTKITIENLEYATSKDLLVIALNLIKGSAMWLADNKTKKGESDDVSPAESFGIAVQVLADANTMTINRLRGDDK